MFVLILALAQAEQEFPPSLDGVSLHEITLTVQKRTGARFLWTEEAGLRTRKIYYKSDTPLRGRDAILTLYGSFLQLHGLALVPVGDAYKIQAAGGKPAVPVVDSVDPADRLVTRVFTLRHASPREAHAALINLTSFPQGMLALESSRILIVTDYDHNLRRFEQILDRMDRPRVVRIVPLKHALAPEVEAMLKDAGVKVFADRRTNSIVLIGDPGQIDPVEEMARALDQDFGEESSGTWVIHLRHTRAATIAKTLASAYAGLVVVADETTNGLIVTADRRTFRSVEGVVRKLDSRRPQVLMQAAVIEVFTSEQDELAVELAKLLDDDRVLVASKTGVGGLDTPGLLGLVRDKLGNIGAVVRALRGRARVSILDQPEVATIDNGSAEMKVEVQVPVLRTTVINGVAQTEFARFETAETTLSISPHVSEAGYLWLETTIRIQKFTREAADPTVPPPKTSREIRISSIRVPDRRTVVIGGIVTQDETEGETGVPILMDLPLLGPLFRRTTHSQEQRTLYVFLTPTVLQDEGFGDHRDLTRERRDELERLRGGMLDRLMVEGEPELRPRSTYRWARN